MSLEDAVWLVAPLAATGPLLEVAAAVLGVLNTLLPPALLACTTGEPEVPAGGPTVENELDPRLDRALKGAFLSADELATGVEGPAPGVE
jgi:hypothetical protein